MGSDAVRRTTAVLDRVAMLLAGVGLSAILVATLIQVVSRHVLAGGIHGVVDLTAQFFMPVAVLFAITLAERAGTHVRIVVLTERLPAKTQRWFRVAGYLVTIVLSALIVWATAISALDAYSRGTLTSGDIHVPLFIPLAIPPIAFSILLVRLIAQTLQALVGDDWQGARVS